MRTIIRFAIIIMGLSLLTACSNSQIEAGRVEETIRELFAAASASDLKKMADFMTEDFRLAEGGMVLNKKEALDMMKAGEPDTHFEYTITIIDTRVCQDFAWIAYWNDAKIVSKNNTSKIKWFESAVLCKENNRWKLKFAQSTRLEE